VDLKTTKKRLIGTPNTGFFDGSEIHMLKILNHELSLKRKKMETWTKSQQYWKKIEISKFETSFLTSQKLLCFLIGLQKQCLNSEFLKKI
jgi:hypothetical protein